MPKVISVGKHYGLRYVFFPPIVYGLMYNLDNNKIYNFSY